MNILRKKVLKVLPVWLIAILIVGFASAATLVWISNNIRTLVTVTLYPITIDGEFVDSPYLNEQTNEYFGFSVNDAGNAAGYIVIEFTTESPSELLNPGDIEVNDVNVNPTIGTVDLIDGFPTNTAVNQLTFAFGYALDTPINFATDGAGDITFYVTYNVQYSNVAAELRITSTLPEP